MTRADALRPHLKFRRWRGRFGVMTENQNHIKATACQIWNCVTAIFHAIGGILRQMAWVIAIGCLLFAGGVLWPFELLFSDMVAPALVQKTEFLRNIALGVVAALGFPLLLERTRAAIKQADIDSQRLLAERYTRAAELFASRELSARLAGLYALWDLAKEEVEIYHVRIMEILCAFVCNPPELAGWKSVDGKLLAKRPDMEAVLKLIRERTKEQCEQEILVLQPSFRGAAPVREIRFRLDFTDADLRGADLNHAKLQYARFVRANLSCAHFHGADLSYAKFHNADLRGVKFNDSSRFEYSTDPTKLEGVEWQNAALNGARFPLRMQDRDIDAIQSAVILMDDSLGFAVLPSEVEDKLERITMEEWEKRRAGISYA